MPVALSATGRGLPRTGRARPRQSRAGRQRASTEAPYVARGPRVHGGPCEKRSRSASCRTQWHGHVEGVQAAVSGPSLHGRLALRSPTGPRRDSDRAGRDFDRGTASRSVRTSGPTHCTSGRETDGGWSSSVAKRREHSGESALGCGVLLSPEQLAADPHARIGLLQESVHPVAGRLRQPRHPAQFGTTAPSSAARRRCSASTPTRSAASSATTPPASTTSA